ncbi:hypothetical protein CR513_18836, partial [Mucuna pruriens]
MTARTNIDVHVGTLSLEFDDTLVQFNIFEAMKHPTEDHSLFGIDISKNYENIDNFARNVDVTSCLGSTTEEVDYEEVHNLPNSEDNNDDIVDLDFEAELFEEIDQVCNHENLECVNSAETEVARKSKPSSAQLATIFIAQGELATEGRDRRMTKVNSAKQGRDREEKKVDSAKQGRDREEKKVDSAKQGRDREEKKVNSANAGREQVKTKVNLVEV